MVLKHYRILNNLTQKQLAKQMGISASCISQYENGKLKNGVVKKLIDKYIEEIKSKDIIEVETEYTPQNQNNADIQEQEVKEKYINLLLKKALNNVDFEEKKVIINKISSIVNL